MLLKCGVFLGAVCMNGSFSFLWNYLPWVYPTHLRGTGESFAGNIGGRAIGASAALLTTQLANVIPAAGAATRMAYAAGAIAVLTYTVSLIRILAPRTRTSSIAGLKAGQECGQDETLIELLALLKPWQHSSQERGHNMETGHAECSISPDYVFDNASEQAGARFRALSEIFDPARFVISASVASIRAGTAWR